MKKFVAIIMSLIMMFSLIGCGATSEPIITEVETEVESTVVESPSRITLYDADGIVFAVGTELEYDDSWEGNENYSLNIYIENNTDRDLHFRFDRESVNGYTYYTSWGTDIEAGKKQNTSVAFYETWLADCGIVEPISEYEFDLVIGDYNFETYEVTNSFSNEFIVNFE